MFAEIFHVTSYPQQKLKIEAHGVECHVGKGDHRTKLIQETVKKYGGIDILVSNAAVNPVYCKIVEVWTCTSSRAIDTRSEIV